MTPRRTNDEDKLSAVTRWENIHERLAALLRRARFLAPRLIPLTDWLRLIRIPNLLTVPGDLLAGFLLAPAATGQDWRKLLFLALPASLCLYTAGLILNDLFDYAEDKRERPERPLPSGRITRESAATVVMVLLCMAAFATAFFDALPIALLLTVCILLYNGGLKLRPLLGPMVMGGCRAGNLLLGAAAAGDRLVLAPGPIAGALILGGYIATVSHLAQRETHPNATHPPVSIGRLLRMLIPLQAFLAVAALHRFPANLLGLLLLPLLPLHRRLSVRFPPS